MSSSQDHTSPRREFLGHVAGGAIALAAGVALPREASAQMGTEPWLKGLTGKHKQVFDAPESNAGFPFIFASAYIDTMTKTYNLKPGEANAVVVVRHFAAPMALTDAIWAKYKIGEMIGVNDPATKKPSLRNIFYKSKAGDMMMIDASADKMIAKGVTVCVCNLALTVLSGKAAAGAGVTADVALKEWQAGVVPGAHIVPSGVLAVGRTQEMGCNYCFAG